MSQADLGTGYFAHQKSMGNMSIQAKPLQQIGPILDLNSDSFDYHMQCLDYIKTADLLKLIPVIKEHKLEKSKHEITEGELKNMFKTLQDSQIRLIAKALNSYREKFKTVKPAESQFKKKSSSLVPTEPSPDAKERIVLNPIEMLNNAHNALALS